MKPEQISRTQKRLNKRLKQLRRNITPHEKIVMESLKRLGFRYLFQKGWMCKGTSLRIVDFYIPKPYKVIVEVDGSQHTRAKDILREKQILLSVPNAVFFRIKNDEVDSLSAQDRLDAYLLDGIRRVTRYAPY